MAVFVLCKGGNSNFMDSGFYAACVALMARSQAMDLVANNLANTSTPGYRGQHNIFRSFLAAASGHPGSGLNQAVNDFGVSGGSQMDLAQGNLEHTGNDFDLGHARTRVFSSSDHERPCFHAQRKFPSVGARPTGHAQAVRLWVKTKSSHDGGP